MIMWIIENKLDMKKIECTGRMWLNGLEYYTNTNTHTHNIPLIIKIF